MLRVGTGEWSVSVHRDLAGVLDAWKRRPEPECSVGVLHVGFDRPASRSFDDTAASHLGRLLVTGSAKFALPDGFVSSSEPIGFVERIPLYLGLRGWGYLLDDVIEHAPVPPRLPQRRTFGWVREIAAVSPSLFMELDAAGIYDDASYTEFEGALDNTTRRSVGMFRFGVLIGSARGDPCAFARAAPPWLSQREFRSMELTVRLTNVFNRIGVNQVQDLNKFSLAQLLEIKNFGRTSVADLLQLLEGALEEGPFGSRGDIDANSQSSLLAGIRESLSKFEDRDRNIVSRRMGLDDQSETLQQIGESHGVTRERIRQIEFRAAERLRREARWISALSSKSETLLQNREVPLPVLGIEAVDAWFENMAERSDTLHYVLANICHSDVGVIDIDGVKFLTVLNQEKWGAIVDEARRLLQSGAGLNWTEQKCRSLIEPLLPTRAREFKSVLWGKASRLCHFVSTGDGENVFSTYGRGAEHIVEAVLLASDRPLHFTEIATLATIRSGREIDARRAHNAAAEVAMLLGRGTYGLERHLPLGNADLRLLGEQAEELVWEGPSERQWHVSEILTDLIEGGSAAALQVDKYILDVALQKSSGLRRFGRMIWAQQNVDASNTARIDVRQAIVAVVQQAGRPLRAAEIKQRLVAIRGVNEHFQISAADPLLRVAPGLWGLNDRDLAIKRADQPALIEKINDTLEQRGAGIHATEIAAALGNLNSGEITATCLYGLVASDPRMQTNTAQYLYLTKWGGPRRESLADAVNKTLRSAVEPLSFSQIVFAVERRIGRPCERGAVSICLQGVGARLDPATGLWSWGEAENGEIEVFEDLAR
jgi:hypothetical protein